MAKTGFYLLDNPQAVPQCGYPRRGGFKLSGTCIVHTAENATDLVGVDAGAEDVAGFMTRRADYGAYHTLVDSDSILELVPYEWEAWQDSETNPWAVGISAAIQAHRWLDIPLERRKRIYRNLAWAAADFVIYMRDAYGIKVPLKRITGAQARARVPGFCAHGDSGIARTDPGRNFDWTLFFKYTAEEIAKRDGTKTVPASTDNTTPIGEDAMPTTKWNKGKRNELTKGAWKILYFDPAYTTVTIGTGVSMPRGIHLAHLAVSGLEPGEKIAVRFVIDDYTKGKPTKRYRNHREQSIIASKDGGKINARDSITQEINVPKGSNYRIRLEAYAFKDGVVVEDFGVDSYTWK